MTGRHHRPPAARPPTPQPWWVVPLVTIDVGCALVLVVVLPEDPWWWTLARIHLGCFAVLGGAYVLHRLRRAGRT